MYFLSIAGKGFLMKNGLHFFKAKMCAYYSPEYVQLNPILFYNAKELFKLKKRGKILIFTVFNVK